MPPSPPSDREITIETDRAHVQPGMQWLLPSVGDVLFVALLFTLTCGSLAPRLLRDGGTGWHIRTGQIILQTHAVPRTDPFSLSMKDRAWYAWEWLYDTALAATYNWANLNGTVVLTGLVVAGTFLLLFRMLRRRGAGLFTALVLVLLALAAAMIHMYVRPHVVSWLLSLVWWVVLERAHRLGTPWRLIWLPMLMVIWVNVHGGFLVGLALQGIYWIDAAVDVRRAAADPAARRWLAGNTAALLASMAATLVNPFSYRLHTHIYGYLTDRFLMTHIEEFQRPNFHDVSPQCFLLLLSLAVLGIVFARRKPSLREWLVLLLATFTGVYASRNLPVSSILIAVVAGPYFSQVIRERARGRLAGKCLAFADRMSARDAALPGGLWAAAGVIAVLAIAANGGRLGRTVVMRAEFEPQRFPIAAVDFLENHANGASVFTPDQWGGYLIYRGYPGVLVDDRHDLYGDEFFERYLKIVRVEPGWNAALVEMHPSFALIRADSKLAAALRGERGWRAEHQDSVAVLFRRTE